MPRLLRQYPPQNHFLCLPPSPFLHPLTAAGPCPTAPPSTTTPPRRQPTPTPECPAIIRPPPAQHPTLDQAPSPRRAPATTQVTRARTGGRKAPARDGDSGVQGPRPLQQLEELTSLPHPHPPAKAPKAIIYIWPQLPLWPASRHPILRRLGSAPPLCCPTHPSARPMLRRLPLALPHSISKGLPPQPLLQKRQAPARASCPCARPTHPPPKRPPPGGQPPLRAL